MAERGFVPKLGEKRLTVGRERYFSGQCTKRIEASWTQIKYAAFTLLSDRSNALYSLVFLLLGNLQCTAHSLIESLMAVRLYIDA